MAQGKEVLAGPSCRSVILFAENRKLRHPAENEANTIAGRVASHIDCSGDGRPPCQMEARFFGTNRGLRCAGCPRIFRALGLLDHQPAAARTGTNLNHPPLAILRAPSLPDLSSRVCFSSRSGWSLLAGDALDARSGRGVLCLEHGCFAAMDFRAPVVAEYRRAVLSSMAVCIKNVA